MVRAIKLGLPMGVQQVMFSAGMMAMQGLINSKGSTFMAGYNAATRIDSFAFMPFMNISNAAAVFTGQNVGAQRMERVHSGLKSTMTLTIIVLAIITTCVLAFGSPLISLFSKEPEVIAVGTGYLYRTIPFYIVLAMMFNFNGVVRGAGETIVPMIVSVCSLWLVRVPAAYLIDHYFDANNIWFALPIGWAMGLIAIGSYYMSGKWKNKAISRGQSVIEEAPEPE